MTRIVEYSDDDDFPDLATLLKSKPQETRAETKTNEESDDEPRGYSNTRGQRDGDVSERGRGDTGGAEMSVKKTKRVLMPKADNPLLRRMGSTPGRVPETPRGESRGERKVVGKGKLDISHDADVEERKSEDGQEWSDESDGMSDFVVDDSESLEEEESEIEIPPPRSVRRLVQGRRPRKELEDDLDVKMRKLDIKDGDLDGSEGSSGGENKAPKENDREVPRRKKGPEDSPRRARKPKETKDIVFNTVSDIDEPPTQRR
jgi:hypothetical protein